MDGDGIRHGRCPSFCLGTRFVAATLAKDTNVVDGTLLDKTDCTLVVIRPPVDLTSLPQLMRDTSNEGAV